MSFPDWYIGGIGGERSTCLVACSDNVDKKLKEFLEILRGRQVSNSGTTIGRVRGDVVVDEFQAGGPSRRQW